jgi:hypothetical protein
VLRVPSSFRLTLAAGVTLSCAQAAARLLNDTRRWELRSAGPGSKGALWSAWALAATASPRRHLLIRRHLIRLPGSGSQPAVGVRDHPSAGLRPQARKYR